jgi:hypothetical protein
MNEDTSKNESSFKNLQTWNINKENNIKNERLSDLSNCNKTIDNVIYDYKYTKWKNNRKKDYINRYSAGVLPYSYDTEGNCFFLLGKDYSGDWSDFGGRCEHTDRNIEINTACREFYEETLGSVISNTECEYKLKNGNPVKIISKTLNGSPYYMFLLYIDFIDYLEHFNKVLNFIKYNSNSKNIFNRNFLNDSKIIEKVSIRWISFDTIISCIEKRKNTNNAGTITLREVFLSTLKICKEQLIIIQSR